MAGKKKPTKQDAVQATEDLTQELLADPEMLFDVSVLEEKKIVLAEIARELIEKGTERVPNGDGTFRRGLIPMPCAKGMSYRINTGDVGLDSFLTAVMPRLNAVVGDVAGAEDHAAKILAQKIIHTHESSRPPASPPLPNSRAIWPGHASDHVTDECKRLLYTALGSLNAMSAGTGRS